VSQRANLIKCAGLVTHGSELTVKEGSLRRADNVNIDEDGVITPRRGFSDYGNATGEENDNKRIKQLFEYKDRIFRHYQDQIQFEDETGQFNNILGSFIELKDGYRIKWQESKGNIYFTTNEGIKRISLLNSSYLYSGANIAIEQSGVPKAAYMEGDSEESVDGFLEPQSKVAYRFIFGKRDANNNLLLGSPSSRHVITNTEERLVTYEKYSVTISQDFSLGSNDSYFIEDGDYIVISSSNTKVTFYFKTSSKNVEIPQNSQTIGSSFVLVDISSTRNSVSYSEHDRTIAYIAGQNVTKNSENYICILDTTHNTSELDQIPGATTSSLYWSKIEQSPSDLVTDSIQNNIDVAGILSGVMSNNLSQYEVTTSISSITLTSKEEGNIEDPYIKNTRSGPDTVQPEVSILYAKTNDGEIEEGANNNARLKLIIPNNVDSSYFIQLYRTSPITRPENLEGITLNDLDPGDEQNLVFETNITEQNRIDGFIEIYDDYPESFRASSAPLYTNEITGEGVLQANDPPPIALDMALFRNSMFYANTKTNHKVELTILSVDDFLSEFTRIIIGNGTKCRYYTATSDYLIEGVSVEGGNFLLSTSSSIAQSIDETSRSLVKVINQDTNSIINAYYLSGSDDIPGKVLLEARSLVNDPFYIGIESGYIEYDSNNKFLNKKVKLNNYDYSLINYEAFHNVPWDSINTYSKNDIILATDNKLYISIEDSNMNNDPVSSSSFWALYSPSPSVYKAGDIVLYLGSYYECNTSTSEIPLSSTNWDNIDKDPSGTTSSNELWAYVEIGKEFNPEVAVSRPISRIIGNGESTIITLNSHGYTTGDQKFISFLSDNDVNAPDSFSGVYTITETGLDTFTINLPMSISIDSEGINGFLLTDTSIYRPTLESDNLEVPNRIYFSKTSEPEAVPSTNYIDVGAKDEQIERILALRDNLFVLKGDGIYMVSGTSAPDFSVRLLDNTRILAPDSAVVLNNQIYSLTEQGVTVITDSGAGIISKGVENLIDDVINAKYEYKRNTFGIAYENDRSYILFCPSNENDTSSTQAYRYNIFERTWSRWEYNSSCGHVMQRDNRLYLGNGDRNYLSQERKNYDRSDICDRDFEAFISSRGVNGTEIDISTTDGIEVNDVITQEQEITINYVNRRLLRKMDLFDSGLELQGTLSSTNPLVLNTPYPHLLSNGSNWDFKIIYNDNGEEKLDVSTYNVTVLNDYSFQINFDNSNSSIISLDILDFYSKTFYVNIGDSMPSKLQDIHDHLSNVDSGIDSKNYTLDNSKENITYLVDRLNSGDTITFLKDYKYPETITFEAYITGVNQRDNFIYSNKERPFLQQQITVYKHIPKLIEWNPQHFGDPSALKQVRSVSIIFDQNNFYVGEARFSSDVVQALTSVPVKGKGIAYWDDLEYNDLNAYWGGEGNDVPFRTVVPRDKQRCRYLTIEYSHRNAREDFRVLGITGVVRPISDRGYR